MANGCDLTGKRFGKLIVIEKTNKKEDRYSVWRCQCDCGKECFVNTKRLKRGTVSDCGCVPKTDMRNGTKASDLSGMTFGSLTAIRRVNNHGERTAWLCKCVCGNEVEVTTHELRSGHTKSCGCMSHANPAYKNLTGQRFGMLTVIEKLDSRDYKGSVQWRCKCDCGNECLYTEDDLVHGNIVSCGCYRRQELPKIMSASLHRIDGTCIERLMSTSPRPDNKSGHVGIHITKDGRYRASIGFKGKRYNLGTYSDLEAAQKARHRGEEIHQNFLEWYYNEYLKGNNENQTNEGAVDPESM